MSRREGQTSISRLSSKIWSLSLPVPMVYAVAGSSAGPGRTESF